MARKLIRSKYVVFLIDQIIDDKKKSNESQSSLKLSIIPTSVSPLIAHDNHEGAIEDNNDGPAQLIDQASPEPFAPPIEPELRRSTRKRRPSTRYLSLEYVMLTDGGKSKYFEEACLTIIKVSGLKPCKRRRNP